MHDTLIPDIKAYIENIVTQVNNRLIIRGWLFNNELKEVCDIRISIDNDSNNNSIINRIERQDVSTFYNIQEIKMCGFIGEIEYKNVSNNIELMIEVFDSNNMSWLKCIKISIPLNEIKIEINTIKAPSFIVVDNFYKNPDDVRNYALRQNFREHKEYHKGCRTDSLHKFVGLKERFELLIGKKIKNWDYYGTNGCFQYCIAGDNLVYHFDGQTYAGLIYLTPDAPPNTGTSFYRSKYTKKMKVSNEDHSVVFKNGFLDSTEFELVETVGNIYNRLILFDAKFIHAASCYFGTTKENGRLFQLFFFDLDS